MAEAKAGTFWCWMFGHKFIGVTWNCDFGGELTRTKTVTD